MKSNLNLVFVTSLLTEQKDGKARNQASQKTTENSTLVHAIGILANQAKATKCSTAACETKIELILNWWLQKIVDEVIYFKDWNSYHKTTYANCHIL